MTGRAMKAKGDKYERELAAYINEATGLQSFRAPLSGGGHVNMVGGADLLGTVGNASGTGLLLAVGIILRTYEQIQKEQAMEMHPMIRQFFGAD